MIMTVLTSKDQRELTTSNVIRFPRAFVPDHTTDTTYMHCASAPDRSTREISRENLSGRIQADHRALSELINTIADARAMIMRLENEIKIRKAVGEQTAPV